MFAVQDEIAAAVVEQLEGKLLSVAPRVRETNPKAYALYLQARQLSFRVTGTSLEQAIELYHEVLAIDPTYAPAWNGLAVSYSNQANQGLRAFDEGYELAREAATKAIAQDPDYAPAHATLGWIARAYDRDLQSAAQHYEHALTLDPANASSIAGAAILAENLGRLDTAIALSEYAVERDPVNPASYFNLAAIYHTARRPDDAIATLRTLFRLSPGHVAAQHGVGVELMLQSRHEAALAAMRDEPDEGWRLMGVAMVEHALGRAAESHAALTELVAKYEKDSAYNIAYVCAVRGEADRAFEWLEKARTYNDPGLPTIEVEPLFDGIHDDPRWLPFLRSIGKAPGQLAAITFDVQLPGKEPREGSGD